MTDEPAPAPTPTVLTAGCVEDFLALAPVLIGFEPEDSVVLLTLEAEHPFHARVDLPGRHRPVTETVELLSGPARRHRVRRAAVVLYGDDRVAAERVWRALAPALDRAGTGVVEAVRADGRRWYPLLGGDRRLRTLGVRYDVSAHPVRAWAVAQGRVVHGSRRALEAMLDSDPAAVAAVLALLDDAAGPGPVLAEGHWAERLVRRHTAAGSSPTDAEVARLVGAVRVDRVRDAACSPLTRPTAAAHVRFWIDVLRRTPRGLVPPVATLLGLAAWQEGNGALAWCAVDRCAAVDPDYTLMTYLAAALDRAVPPDAWKPGPPWETDVTA